MAYLIAGDRALFLAALLVLAGAAGGGAVPADRGAVLLYVALGDSTVSGVGATSPEGSYPSRLLAHLRSVRPAATAVNLGVGGATAADVLREQVPRALELRPDLVSLSVGPNDITTGRSVRQYELDVDRILGRLGRASPTVVVVNLIPDLALTPRFKGTDREGAIARTTERFNQALRRAAGRHRAEVVDLYALSRREVPRNPRLIAEDGYHPSDAGYARWARAMWEGVRTRVGRQ